MKFPNGPRRLTYPGQPGVKMDVIVDDAGMDTPFGRMPYYEPPGIYKRPGNNPLLAVVCETETTGKSVSGADNLPFTHAAL